MKIVYHQIRFSNHVLYENHHLELYKKVEVTKGLHCAPFSGYAMVSMVPVMCRLGVFWVPWRAMDRELQQH